MQRSKLSLALALGSLAVLATACATGGAGTEGDAPGGLEAGMAPDADAGDESALSAAPGDVAADPTTDAADDAAALGADDAAAKEGELPEATDAALTDAPMGPPQDIPASAVSTDSQASSFDEGELSSADTGVVEQALPVPADAAVQTKSTPSPRSSSKGLAKASPKAKKSKQSRRTAQGKKTRYVKGLLLNVRSGPSFNSPIVRRLYGGARITVGKTSGRFVRIKDGQWVSVKNLSVKPTHKASAEEVARAWKRSKYKDTWRQAPNS
jgi:hypothetical protein